MSDFDALIVPGGYAPDRMRMRHAMVDLVRDACAAGKPVAAICHGPQLLISADVLRDRTVTCWPSIAIDVRNAGGLYVDRPVVQDRNLITSRKPDDVPQFTAALLKALDDLITTVAVGRPHLPRGEREDPSRIADSRGSSAVVPRLGPRIRARR